MAELTPKLSLTHTQLEGLEKLCQHELDRLDRLHSTYFNDLSVWWDWYDAKPKVREKQVPWKGASNVVAPVIASAVDSVVADLYATLWSHGKLIGGRSLNEAVQELVPDVEDFLNWAEGKEFDLKSPTYDWMLELATVGEAVLGLRWERKEKWALAPGQTSLKPKRVLLGRGPVIEHIPRHRIMWEPGSTIEDSEVLTKLAFLSYSTLNRMAQTGEWIREAVEEAGRFPDHDSPDLARERRSIERSGMRLEDADNGPGLHRVYEFWMEAPIVGQMDRKLGEQLVTDRTAQIVVTYHATSGRVLRAMPDPYGLGHKPFYEGFYRKRSGQPHGRGLAKMLEHTQRSISTSVNQGHDSVTFHNSLGFVTTDKKLAERQYLPFAGIHVSDMNSFAPVNKPTSVMPEIALVNIMQVLGERLSGRTDPLMGRESRSGGHPSPATNFVGMMEQGRKLVSPTMWSIRGALGKLFGDLATMYQLYDMDVEGRIDRILGPRDGAKVKAWLFPKDAALIESIQFDIFAVDENDNPQTRQQMALTTMQVANNYTAFVLPLFQAVMDPRLPAPLRSLTAQQVEAYTRLYIRYLQAADVDDIENYTILVEELKAHGIGQLNDYLEQARQVAQLQASSEGREESVRGGGDGGAEAQPQGRAAGGARALSIV